MISKNFFKQCVAELIGTFGLVFFGCGAMIVHQLYPQALGNVGIPLVFGLVVMVLIYAVGHISGAHFNPAVTVAFAVTRHFPIYKVIGYVVSQSLGAILASGVHFLFLSSADHDFGMTNSLLPGMMGMGIEIILSFFLMFVIVSVATDTRAVGELAGLAIGGAVAICSFVGGPLTGASMNPARSLGPAIWAGEFTSLWIYIVGPLLGAILGAVVYQRIRCDGDDAEGGAGGCC